MTAARAVFLLLAAWTVLAALGATTGELQPSALRLAVAAVIALLAPLFWPGAAATAMRTALRVFAWSVAAACLAAAAIRLLGSPPQPVERLLATGGVLLLILLLSHGAAALLEARWRATGVDAHRARETSGRVVAAALAGLGSLPLWFGPFAQLLSDRSAWIVDAAVGASPLTHLAVASGNDLLRNQWFYQHSNLAALPVSYPGAATVALSYASLLSMLALGTLALSAGRSDPADASKEKSP